MKADCRPHKNLGIGIIALGIANLVFGLTTVLESTLGSVIGGTLDKLVCLLMIGMGAYLLRKRIIATDNAVTLIGLVDGKSKIEIPVDQIKGVTFNPLRQKAEIRTDSGLLYAGIGKDSEAFTILSGVVPFKADENETPKNG